VARAVGGPDCRGEDYMSRQQAPDDGFVSHRFIDFGW